MPPIYYWFREYNRKLVLSNEFFEFEFSLLEETWFLGLDPLFNVFMLSISSFLSPVF